MHVKQGTYHPIPTYEEGRSQSEDQMSKNGNLVSSLGQKYDGVRLSQTILALHRDIMH
jgi:hypothetical protein